jgi:hypothetical protein
MDSLTPRERDELAALRQRVHDLECCLGLHDDHLGVFFRLPSSLTKLLGLLMARPNVTPEMIHQRLEIATDAKVAVHRLRAHLKKWSEENGETPVLDIESRRTLGYWLDDRVKKRITELTVTPEGIGEGIILVEDTSPPASASGGAA